MAEETSWIKLHRKAIDSQVFSSPQLWHCFCWCLMKANWKDGWFQGEHIKAGSFATGRDSAAYELRVSGSKWYRMIKKLESLELISVKSNNRFSIISVEKWAQYQSEKQKANNKWTTDEQQTNNKRTTDEQQADTIEEGKERKEGKEEQEQQVDCWVLPEGWDLPEVRKALDDWAAMRIRKKVPVRSRRSTSKIFKQFDSPQHLIRVCEICEANEWQGLKPEYSGSGSSKSRTEQRLEKTVNVLQDWANGKS